MPRREREKGRAGQAEVREILDRHGIAAHAGQANLQGVADVLASLPDVTLHIEVKRQETARPWPWIRQAEGDAKPGTVPIVAFRRSHSKWYAIIELELLLTELAK
jgi:Holliday junction resolvase